MSVALYDKALTAKLKALTEKTNIHIYSPDDSRRLFEIIADESDDKPIKLPIIRLSRVDGYTIKERGNNPRSKNALGVKLSSVTGESVFKLNCIPIEIDYQIDVYTRKFIEADAIMREMVFILTNEPNVDIVIPYNGLEYTHRSALSLDTTVSDSSGIPERLISGQFSRLSIKCSIPDAYLWDVRINSFTKVYGDLDIMSPSLAVEDYDVTTEELDFGYQI